jgi:hypothetical protein
MTKSISPEVVPSPLSPNEVNDYRNLKKKFELLADPSSKAHAEPDTYSSSEDEDVEE